MKYWEILLVEWRKIDRNGFTIPYIIGSQQFLNHTSNQKIEDLIIDIIENSKNEIYITYCMTINDLILGVRDNSKKKINGYFPKYNGKDQNKFFVTSFVSNLGSDIKEIIENLNNRYSERILKKEFSTNNRIFGDYNQNEKKFIIRCLN